MSGHSKALIALGILLAIAGSIYFAATRALDHLVRDGTFLRLISRKTAVKLNADCGYLPIAWRGMNIQSSGVLARGQPPRSLVELGAIDSKFRSLRRKSRACAALRENSRSRTRTSTANSRSAPRPMWSMPCPVRAREFLPNPTAPIYGPR